MRKCPVTNQFSCPLTDKRDYADGLAMCAPPSALARSHLDWAVLHVTAGLSCLAWLTYVPLQACVQPRQRVDRHGHAASSKGLSVPACMQALPTTTVHCEGPSWQAAPFHAQLGSSGPSAEHG